MCVGMLHGNGEARESNGVVSGTVICSERKVRASMVVKFYLLCMKSTMKVCAVLTLMGLGYGEDRGMAISPNRGKVLM
jgi:hypothetical protein